MTTETENAREPTKPTAGPCRQASLVGEKRLARDDKFSNQKKKKRASQKREKANAEA